MFSDRRIASALEAGAVGLWRWEVGSDRIEWSPNLAQIHGWERGSFDGRFETFAADIHPEDRDRVMAAITSALEHGEGYQVEYRLPPRADGSVRWIEARGRVERQYGTAVAMTGICHDVTERKLAEERHRERSAQLETIMETVPAIVWIAHDAEAKRITGSRYAAEHLNLPRDRNQSLTAPANERPRHFRVLRDGEEVPPHQLPIQRAARGEEVRDEELEVVFEDGTSRWELVGASPVRGIDGTPIGAVGAGINITERKRAQEHQAMLMAELDHRVKNLLALVESLVLQTLKDPTEAAALSGRVGALAATHELLAQEEWRGTSVRALLETALRPYRTDVRERRLRFTGPDVFLKARPAQTLVLALNELSTNAVKYGALSGPGGAVDVSWNILGTDEPAPALEIAWLETGGPPVSAPARRGFGLRFIERSVALEGGTAEISFDPHGLRCRIELQGAVVTAPDALGRVADTSPAAAAEPARLVGCRVLVVEDEPLLAAGVSGTLARVGCRIVGPATRLDAAIRTVLSEPVDAAVLDINLAGELVSPLAELLVQKRVPFVFLTGYGRLDAVPQHLRRTLVVRKPVRDEDLITALARAVRERAPRRGAD